MSPRTDVIIHRGIFGVKCIKKALLGSRSSVVLPDAQMCVVAIRLRGKSGVVDHRGPSSEDASSCIRGCAPSAANWNQAGVK